MSFEDGIKMWREEIGQYYDEHFSEEQMEILYEIVRGNVDVDTMKEKLIEFFEDSDIPAIPFFSFIVQSFIIQSRLVSRHFSPPLFD